LATLLKEESVNGTGKWLAGGLLSILGLFGLGLSAHSHDAAFSLFGLLLFAFAVVMIFRFITLGTSTREEQ